MIYEWCRRQCWRKISSSVGLQNRTFYPPMGRGARAQRTRKDPSIHMLPPLYIYLSFRCCSACFLFIFVSCACTCCALCLFYICWWVYVCAPLPRPPCLRRWRVRWREETQSRLCWCRRGPSLRLFLQTTVNLPRILTTPLFKFSSFFSKIAPFWAWVSLWFCIV